MTQKRFANQRVIVTGAGEGIGYEVARQFCAEGASVLLNDILPERANAAAEAIASETGADCSRRRAMSPMSRRCAGW